MWPPVYMPFVVAEDSHLLPARPQITKLPHPSLSPQQARSASNLFLGNRQTGRRRFFHSNSPRDDSTTISRVRLDRRAIGVCARKGGGYGQRARQKVGMIMDSGISGVTDQKPSGLFELPEKKVRIANVSISDYA